MGGRERERKITFINVMNWKNTNEINPHQNEIHSNGIL